MTQDGAAMSPLELTVKSMSGEEVAQLRLPPGAVVLDAKKELAPKVGLNRFRLRLVFGSSDSVAADTTPLREFVQPLTAMFFELPYEMDPAQVACMCAYAREDNVQEVERFLNVPIWPDAVNTQPLQGDGLPNAGRCTALMAAAAGCHVETMQLLCEAGASVDKGEPAPDGPTPLVCCCVTKPASPARRYEALRLLLGFSVSKRSKTDALARILHEPSNQWGIEARRSEEEWQSWGDTVHMLINSGADPEEHKELWQALFNGEWRVAKFLKDVGVTPVPLRELLCELGFRKHGGNFILLGFLLLVIAFAGACRLQLANRQILACAEAWVGFIGGFFQVFAYTWFMGDAAESAPALPQEWLVHFQRAALLFVITSVVVALEMSAADDLIHVGDTLAKPGGVSKVLALPAAIAAFLPILAAAGCCVLQTGFNCGSAFASGATEPQRRGYDHKFKTYAVMIPGILVAGWFMHNEWMRLGDTRLRLFTIFVMNLPGIFLIYWGGCLMGAFNLFPHAVASCLARPRKMQSLQEPLL